MRVPLFRKSNLPHNYGIIMDGYLIIPTVGFACFSAWFACNILLGCAFGHLDEDAVKLKDSWFEYTCATFNSAAACLHHRFPNVLCEAEAPLSRPCVHYESQKRHTIHTPIEKYHSKTQKQKECLLTPLDSYPTWIAHGLLQLFSGLTSSLILHEGLGESPLVVNPPTHLNMWLACANCKAIQKKWLGKPLPELVMRQIPGPFPFSPQSSPQERTFVCSGFKIKCTTLRLPKTRVLTHSHHQG